MHSAFFRQSVSCPILSGGFAEPAGTEASVCGDTAPGKIISVTLVYFPLQAFSHGVRLSVTSGERLGDCSLSFWWALVSGGLLVLCGYWHLFL